MISFVIPAHNEEGDLAATLRQLKESADAAGRPYEIIVVDDASTDRTGEIAAAGVATVVRVEHRQIAATRNAGARRATGDVLIFVDAETLVPPETLAAALRALDDGAIGGGVGVQFDHGVGWWGRRFVMVWNIISRIMRCAAGCFIFVRQDAFIAVGGFDERYYASEEIWLSRELKRIGRFIILREQVTTSGRKVRMHPARRWIPMVFKLLLMGPRSW